MNEVVINFTPTGLIPRKKDNPFTPISANEIIEEVHSAYETGITMVHLHARDEVTELPSFSSRHYAAIIEGIRKVAPALVLGVSTSGRYGIDLASRMEVLELDGPAKPDMASLTLSSLNFNQQASINSPETIIALAGKMKDRKIKPELEAFDAGMLNYAQYLARKKWIEPPFYVNLILGNIACAQADLLHAALMVERLPEPCLFSMGGIGQAQLRVNSLAISMGYGVRVGLEDNYWYDGNRTKLATNQDLLRRIHTILAANERVVMTSKDFRKKMALLPGQGQYGCL